MPTDPRVDNYIEEAAEFARPILKHIRAVVHKACPEVTETIKWSFPHFECNGMICGMAAHKAHCSLGFWKGELIFGDTGKDGMGSFGRIESIEDLPSEKDLTKYVKEAVRLNEAGVKRTLPDRSKEKKDLVLPDSLLAALKTNKAARETFKNFSYSHKKEYVEWITEAKRNETREKRLATAIEWLAEGKSRNWKYERC